MARKVIDIIYNLVRKRKTLTESGPGSKVISLPDDDSIKRGMEDVFKRLRDGGYNVVSADKAIKSEADLARILEEINQAEIAAIKRRQDASEGLETVMYKLEKGIPLNPGDQAKIEGAGMKTTLDAFEGFKPKVIEGGKKEGIEQLLKEGKITKGTAPKTTKKKPAVDPELQKSEDLKKEFKDFEERTEIKDLDDEPDGLAKGGIAKTRIGMNIGGRLLKFLSENSPFQAYKKYLQSVKRRSIEGDFKSLAPELGAVSAGGILINRKMKSILEGMKEQDNERFLKEFKADLDKDPFYKDRPELKDKAIENYTETLFGEKKAMGGRIGFKEGSGMTRRTFLKLLGGLASLPFVGKFLKPAAKTSKAVEVASKSAEVPSYFPKLVEKIQLLGDDFTKTAATKERQVVTKYKDYELTEDLSTGELRIKRDNYTSEEYLQYEPGGSYYDETRNKVIKYPETYEEVTVKPDYEGKMKDVDYGLDNIDEIMKEVDMIETDYKIAPSGKPRDKKLGGGLAYMMGE